MSGTVERQSRTDPEQLAAEQARPTIGILTALTKETAAVEAMLENPREIWVEGVPYILGALPAANGGQHAIVVRETGMGTNAAAARATALLKDFPNVEYVLMTGIAAGVPKPDEPDEHVRLGDVVVSDERGVIQYDYTRQTGELPIPRPLPRAPSPRLLEAARAILRAELKGQRQWIDLIARAAHLQDAARPPEAEDVLSDPADPARTLPHPPDPRRRPGEPRCFLAPIASANNLLRYAARRDELAQRFGVKAIEMEGSGIADAAWNHEAGFLIVRGICDYGDANKRDRWQGYAAVTAAAFTRALLEKVEARSGPGAASPPGGIAPSHWPSGAAPVEWLHRCLEHQARAQLLAGAGSPAEPFERSWTACLRAWPSLTFWSRQPMSAGLPPDFGLAHNPFGFERAEDDPLLLRTRHETTTFSRLRSNLSTLIHGVSGSGKTAAALFVAHEALLGRFQRAYYWQLGVFPVYCALQPSLQAAHLGAAAARTMLSYLLANPSDYYNLPPEGQAAIGQLVDQYAPRGDELVQLLLQFGFLTDGSGQLTLDTIRRLTSAAAPSPSPSSAAALQQVAVARPGDYARTLLILDWPGDQAGDGAAALASLGFLRGAPKHPDLLFKVFLPSLDAPGLTRARDELRIEEALVWRWEEADIAQWLLKRLETVGETAWASWCDFGARSAGTNDRLIRAAAGRPVELIRRGNALLARIAAAGRLLSRADLDEILGQPEGV